MKWWEKFCDEGGVWPFLVAGVVIGMWQLLLFAILGSTAFSFRRQLVIAVVMGALLGPMLVWVGKAGPKVDK